jgi:hypothetical protein
MYRRKKDLMRCHRRRDTVVFCFGAAIPAALSDHGRRKYGLRPIAVNPEIDDSIRQQ